MTLADPLLQKKDYAASSLRREQRAVDWEIENMYCSVDQIAVASELTDLFDDRIVIDINYIHWF